jgi:hypothetical protein
MSLYPYDDVYQVVSEDESIVYFQGSKEKCVFFIQVENENQALRVEHFSRIKQQEQTFKSE